MPLEPGKAINFNDRHWRPTGTAEGVFYLGEKPRLAQMMTKLGADAFFKVTKRPSADLEAMRFLRPPGQEWCREHEDQSGYTRVGHWIGVTDLPGMPDELKKASVKQGRPIHHLFSADSIRSAIRMKKL